MYGKPSTKIKYLDDIGISRNRFKTLRNNLHIVDINEAHNPEDKLWKIRPLVNYFDKKCGKLTIKEQLYIDESIIPFKGQLVEKQYIKGKPNPWGVKFFMLCGDLASFINLLYAKDLQPFLQTFRTNIRPQMGWLCT